MSSSTKFRALLAGCGGISAAWLNAIQNRDDVEMVAFVDLSLPAAQNRAASFGWKDALVTDNFVAALEQTKPDLVFDCTIPEAHHTITTLALDYGCHVLGEKPMSTTLASAREMVERARATNRQYAVTQTRRFDPNIRRLQQFLSSGVLGAITTVDADFYIGAHFGGFRDHMAHVLIVDMAIHTFDAARLITGGNAVEVFCREWNPRGSWYDRDASAAAIFTLAGGAVFNYRGSWCAEGFPTTWESSWRVVCEQGTVLWDGGTAIKAQRVCKRGGFHSEMEDVEVPAIAPLAHTGHAGAIDHFLTCLKSGTQPETRAEDNIRSLAMVLSAVESSEQGVPVPVPLA